MEQVHKYVKDAQEATLGITDLRDCATALRDRATALRDRLVLLREYVNNNLPAGLDPIAEFDPIPA